MHEVTRVGADRKANVGMSNDNASEKLAHRKAKGSRDNVNRSGVSQDLRSARQQNFDGKPVNILVPVCGIQSMTERWRGHVETEFYVEAQARSRVKPSGDTEDLKELPRKVDCVYVQTACTVNRHRWLGRRY